MPSSLLLHGALAADTSSILYAHHCGLCETLASAYSLRLPRQVADELGFVPPSCAVRDGLAGCADQALLRLAADEQLVLLSEDGPLLKQAARQGLEYCNLMVVLIALRARNELAPPVYAAAIAALAGRARYSRKVWEFAAMIEHDVLSPAGCCLTGYAGIIQ
jgi:hypothetical protein